MELNKIYYNEKKEFYYYVLSKDEERYYGRTSSIVKSTFLDGVMGMNDNSDLFKFTDGIQIKYNNIYNPKLEWEKEFKLVYEPNEEEIEEFRKIIKIKEGINKSENRIK